MFLDGMKPALFLSLSARNMQIMKVKLWTQRDVTHHFLGTCRPWVIRVDGLSAGVRGINTFLMLHAVVTGYWVSPSNWDPIKSAWLEGKNIKSQLKILFANSWPHAGTGGNFIETSSVSRLKFNYVIPRCYLVGENVCDPNRNVWVIRTTRPSSVPGTRDGCPWLEQLVRFKQQTCTNHWTREIKPSH